MRGRCVYCMANGNLRDEQVLERGEHLYVCVPRGQLVEGFLVIAPYRCLPAYSTAPAAFLDELSWLSARVAEFYAQAYGAPATTRYEQGRGGGSATLDGADGFPLHAHLCHLPKAVDLHGALEATLQRVGVRGPDELPAVAAHQPYVYVDGAGGRAVYLARSRRDRDGLTSGRLRHTVADLIGHPERASWRDYPGDQEVTRVIRRWRKMWTN